ncbi:MAG: DUF1499 domain-containing protein [Alcanivorax sp.]|nr:DUF1499 domain-containing protein [Alcanivorax sp.]
MSDTHLLAPCPNAPHCVSSLATNEKHHVAPLAVSNNRADSMARIQAVLDTLPRVDYEVVGKSRIQARFKSLIFRFVDDVTFYVREDGTAEVRSSSRIGYYDFGVNRRRVESLREQLAEPKTDDQTSQRDYSGQSHSMG